MFSVLFLGFFCTCAVFFNSGPDGCLTESWDDEDSLSLEEDESDPLEDDEEPEEESDDEPEDDSVELSAYNVQI